VLECLAEVKAKLQLLWGSGAAVDEHTADQLVMYMTLSAGVSRILVAPERTGESSRHLETVAVLAKQLLGVDVSIDEQQNGCRLIQCEGLGLAG
jgi:RNA 3'-terminal phosphate cyclase